MLLRIIGGLFLILIIVAGYFAYSINRYWDQPISRSSQVVDFEVVKGTGFSKIANQLQQSGVIEKPLYWKLLALYKDQAHQIKSGEYKLPLQSTPSEILQLLVDGQVTSYQLTVIEGVRFADFWEQVQSNPKISVQIDDPPQLMNRLNPVPEHLEGWFMPDTYTFSKGTTDLELFEQSYSLMRDFLAEQWQQRVADLPYENPYQALIMASIIEKETSVDSERTLIAGVFVERLRKGMKLQTDPTVIYGMGEAYDGNIRRSDLRQDTPYNTYIRNGLPPTPICLPSRASIKAALQPEKTKHLFFVSKGDGTHFFSTNYEDHAKAVRKYQLKKGVK